MSEFNSNVDVKQGSEKGFGIVFCVVFVIIGLYPLTAGENISGWALFVALTWLLLAFFAPGLLALPNRLWFKLGNAMGAVVAPVVMTLIFCLTIVPMALLLKLLGKDLLRERLDSGTNSYWIKRTDPASSLSDQF